MSEPEGKSGGNGCFYALIIAIAFFAILGFVSCTAALFSPDSSDSKTEIYNSYEKDDEQAEEEASHYYYDSYGHIHDDRDQDRFN